MNLFATINQYLSDKLLAQLADASAMPLAATKEYCALVVPALVRQLTQPTDADELNARWDMCRQLYISQILTESGELLRSDMGWPDRRRYLAQKILGAAQVTALTEASAQPAQAATLLGYLTVVALAVLGEQASVGGLSPASLGSWLQEQEVPAAASRPAPAASAPAAPRTRAQREAAPALQTASTSTSKSNKVTIISTIGALALVGVVGSYFLLGTPANATSGQPAPAETEAPATPAAPAPVAEAVAPVAAPLAAAPAASPLAPSAVAAPSAAPAHAAGAAAGLRDTVGNAALARQIGGKFNVAVGRYPKGEGQPLIVKLVNRDTLTVGINSTESLLYKRLASPALPRPSDVALDRLAFDQGQARLGAEGAQQLGNVASLLKTFPKVRLLVVGHANNQEAQAIRLGLQRATAAVDELVKQGIPADRLQAQGVLATELPTDNDSAEKQALLQGISLKVSRL